MAFGIGLLVLALILACFSIYGLIHKEPSAGYAMGWALVAIYGGLRLLEVIPPLV